MEALKKFRIAQSLTIQEMAEKIKVSKSLYEKIEYGFKKPSRAFTVKFKKIFPEFDVNIFFIN